VWRLVSQPLQFVTQGHLPLTLNLPDKEPAEVLATWMSGPPDTVSALLKDTASLCSLAPIAASEPLPPARCNYGCDSTISSSYCPPDTR
jgi:hypothetical protein